MAFKMNYLFEGDFKSKPEQNFSGATKKLSRDAFLQSTLEERKKRQDQRRKLLSAEILQTYIKSYLVRKQVKEEQRQLFDSLEEQGASLSLLTSKLLFFYNSKEDTERLLSTSIKLLNEKHNVFAEMKKNTSFLWQMKRYLSLCLKNLQNVDKSIILINILYIFSDSKDVVEYLVRKGYYKYMRSYLEYSAKSCDQIFELIQRPLNYLKNDENFNDLILSEFSFNFLGPPLTVKVKGKVLPFLRNEGNVTVFVKLVDFLNRKFFFEESDDLCYCLLALEPNEFETNLSYIQVLSKCTRTLQKFTPIHSSSSTYSISSSSSSSDNEDDVEYHPSSTKRTFKQVNFSEYISAMNRPGRISKWFRFLERNIDREEVLVAVIKWCHNLLLDHKEAIRKYLFLYKLGLNGRFLNKLWLYLKNNYGDQLQTRTLYQNFRSDGRVTLSVFCGMFIFYTETLTDEEKSDTSETFSKSDLFYMCKLLKTVAKETIEVAFPMSRTSSLPAITETHQLYRVTLNGLKTLYMLDLREQFCPPGFWSSDKIFIPHDLARNLSEVPLTSHTLFGNERHNDPDEHMAPLSTIERRSLAILEELPFLIPFNTRFLLLRDLCRNSIMETDYLRLHDILNDRAIVIRRTHLYEDAFEKLSNVSETDFRRRLRIQFINSVGLEEAGIDGGGIFKEFLNEVLKTAFDPNRGFFLLTPDNMLYPNPNVHLIVENYAEHYYFIGRLIGKAIFENILVDLPLAEFFLAKLLVDRASAHYLKSLDPLLYKNLLYLRDCRGDISDLGLDFTIVNYDLGETRVVELKRDGANVPVTNENRLEYIQRLADFKLNMQLDKQCRAFKAGVCGVVSQRWLRFFDHKELQIIIGGNNQDVDVDDLKAHTLYGGDFTENHPTIVLFWKILRGFTDTQKRQLLKFVTSCSRPPLLGFKELNPEFCILSSGTENRMPTASTCLNLLKLPVLDDEETLRSKLLEAIQQQAGFELS